MVRYKATGRPLQPVEERVKRGEIKKKERKKEKNMKSAMAKPMETNLMEKARQLVERLR